MFYKISKTWKDRWKFPRESGKLIAETSRHVNVVDPGVGGGGDKIAEHVSHHVVLI